MSKELVFVGDLHGDLQGLKDLLTERPYIKRTIQVGDLGCFYSEEAARRDSDWKRFPDKIRSVLEYKPEMPCQVMFIKGNHEHFQMLESPLLNDLNISYIAQGDVKEILGFKIGFLGGIYSPKAIDKDPEDLKDKRKRFYTRSDIETLKENAKDGIDILVTHEGPKGLFSVPDYPYNRGTDIILNLLRKLGPKHHIHGHHHYNYERKYHYNGAIVTGLGNFNRNKNSFKLI